MRPRLLLALFATGVLLAPSGASAQVSQKDAVLRAHLGVEDTVAVRTSVQRTLPEANPLRVALAFGLDVEVVNNFIKWVEDDWNRKRDASRHGRIELVDDIHSADVVLARFLERELFAGAASSANVYAANNVAVGGASTRPLVPLYAYILKKVPAGYDVLGGYESTTTPDGSGGSGRALWDEFKKLMKTRRSR
jgi:hypothetical protein